MKPQPKRTSTQQGLGKVNADDAPVSAAVGSSDAELRRTSKRERFDIDAPADSSQPGRPVKSAPPIGREDPDEVEAQPRARVAQAPPPPARAGSTPLSERTVPYSERFPRSEPPVFGNRPGSKAAPARSSAPPKKKVASAAPKTGVRGRSIAPRGRSVAPPPPRGRSVPPPRASASVRPSDTQPPKSAPTTDTRRRTLSNREPVAVDHVGNVNVNVNVSKGGSSAVGVAGRGIPKIVRSKDEIAAAPIDHRAGFLLAHIDGVTTVQGLVDIAGMAEEDVHAILERLRRLGIVTIR